MPQRQNRKETIENILRHEQSQPPPTQSGTTDIAIQGDNNGTINFGTIINATASDTPPGDDEETAQWRRQVQAQVNANAQRLQELLNVFATPDKASQTKRPKRPILQKVANQKTTATLAIPTLHATCDLTATTRVVTAAYSSASNMFARFRQRATKAACRWRKTARNARHTTLTACRAIVYAPTRGFAIVQSFALNLSQQFFFARNANQGQVAFTIPVNPGRFRYFPVSQTIWPLT